MWLSTSLRFFHLKPMFDYTTWLAKHDILILYYERQGGPFLKHVWSQINTTLVWDDGALSRRRSTTPRSSTYLRRDDYNTLEGAPAF